MASLRGDKAVLRTYRREDIEGIRAWVNDPDAAGQMGSYYAKPITWEQSEESLHLILRGDSAGVHFVIADPESGEYIGQCDLLRFDYHARSAELSIVVLAENRNRGVGGEAVRLLIRYAFEQMNMNRVSLRVFADNEGAVRCYEKCGFQIEGRLRQDGYRNGMYRDVLVMGVLREDFYR